MKLIYIVGMEHSGSTLTDHLLSQHSNVLGLGEITSFFSEKHMSQYMARWSDYPDAKLCSCGRQWESCEFWGHLIELCGFNSNQPLIEKYSRLVNFVRSNYNPDITIIDSSKNLKTLELLIQEHKNIGISLDEIAILFVVKDVRSFTKSILRKNYYDSRILPIFRTFNWWLGVNKAIVEKLKKEKLSFHTILYEQLCLDPEKNVQETLNFCNLSSDYNTLDISHNNSHIAMGNKNFTSRNRHSLRYDSRWITDDGINLAYLLHGRARSFNKLLHAGYHLSKTHLRNRASSTDANL